MTEPDDRGAFAALELVIVTPFVIVMLLLVVGFGRVNRGRQLADQAAQAAARAASLTSTPADARRAGNRAAARTLSDSGLSCRTMDVAIDMSQFRAGGQVTAAIACTSALSDLALAGLPGSVTLRATATAPLETYRPLGIRP
jgi:Flp pilus assembly protein TadG